MKTVDFIHIKKKDRLRFYSELKINFSEVAEMKFWLEHDYEDDPFESAGIMTEIGKTVINWAKNNEIDKIGSLMNFFEESYKSFSDEVTCYIYTDFLPTIISMDNSELREVIKTQILTDTMKCYNQLLDLGLYVEN